MKKYLLGMDENTGIILSNTDEGKIVALVNGKLYNCIDYRPINEGNGRQLRNESQLAIKSLYQNAVIRLNEYRKAEENNTVSSSVPAPVPVSAPAVPAIDYTALASAFTSALSPLVSALVPAPVEEKQSSITMPLSPLAEKIVKRFKRGHNVYLQGPAGCGKSFIARQVAEALNVGYYETPAVVDIYTQLEGFVDANGSYHGTSFYKAWKDGGVFLFDEIDASSPAALLEINNALANGAYTFPEIAGGYIKRNPQCYIMAAANTGGRGGDGQYTARSVLDASSRDRFIAHLKVDYDRDIELQIAGDDEQLVSYVHALRKAASDCGIQEIFSYRCISGLREIAEDDNKEEAIIERVWRDMDSSDFRILCNNVGRFLDNNDNEWFQAMREVCNNV